MYVLYYQQENTKRFYWWQCPSMDIQVLVHLLFKILILKSFTVLLIKHTEHWFITYVIITRALCTEFWQTSHSNNFRFIFRTQAWGKGSVMKISLYSESKVKILQTSKLLLCWLCFMHLHRVLIKCSLLNNNFRFIFSISA